MFFKQLIKSPSTGAFITVVAEVHTDNKNLKVKVIDAKGEIQHDDSSSKTTMKFGFTTENDGNVQFCFGNEGADSLRFSFKFVTGIEAKDYSDMIKLSHLAPLELSIIKMEEMLETIKNEMRFLVLKEGQRIANVEDISYKILGFSLISLGLITLLSIFQMTYLKDFFKKKKLI